VVVSAMASLRGAAAVVPSDIARMPTQVCSDLTFFNSLMLDPKPHAIAKQVNIRKISVMQLCT
jgi:hypothetical protein